MARTRRRYEMDAAADLQRRVAGFFPDVLGLRFVSATKERVVAEVDVRDELCTVPGVMHGGALMALADTMGAAGTVLNLPEGSSGTTTLESKTNFFAAGRGGTTVTAECVPLHIGRRTMVWQTTIRGADGKLVAQVTQTQMVL
jgi:1,4-dihydroxy-2-naphthoyl-CoA hydrolase